MTSLKCKTSLQGLCASFTILVSSGNMVLKLSPLSPLRKSTTSWKVFNCTPLCFAISRHIFRWSLSLLSSKSSPYNWDGFTVSLSCYKILNILHVIKYRLTESAVQRCHCSLHCFIILLSVAYIASGDWKMCGGSLHLSSLQGIFLGLGMVGLFKFS